MIGSVMIGAVIASALLLSLLLGLLVLGVALLWQPQSLIPLYLRCTLFGFLAALCMLGLVILGNRLGCWLTTSC